MYMYLNRHVFVMHSTCLLLISGAIHLYFDAQSDLGFAPDNSKTFLFYFLFVQCHMP